MRKSKALSEESIKPPAKSGNSLHPGLNYINNAKTQVKFIGSCLNQEKATFNHKTIINFYIVYEINGHVSLI